MDDTVGKSFDMFLVEEGFRHLKMRIGLMRFAGKASQCRVAGSAPAGSVNSPSDMFFTHLRTTGVHHYYSSLRRMRITSLHSPLLIELFDDPVLESFHLPSDAVGELANVLLRYDQFGKFFEVMPGLSI
jgi:hypothetical protein